MPHSLLYAIACVVVPVIWGLVVVAATSWVETRLHRLRQGKQTIAQDDQV